MKAFGKNVLDTLAVLSAPGLRYTWCICDCQPVPSTVYNFIALFGEFEINDAWFEHNLQGEGRHEQWASRGERK